MANTVKYISSHKASIFTKARLALTDAGKKITCLNEHCEIILDAGQIIFRPIVYFMEGTKTNKKGEKTPIDLSNVKNGALDFVQRTLTELGFQTVKNIYRSTGKADIAIPLDKEKNLQLFKRFGQMFEFNRFSMGFKRLDKAGVNSVIEEYKGHVR